MQFSSLGRRIVRLNLGLFLVALSIVVMLNAHTGVDPWSVFHDGLTRKLPLSFGVIALVSGLLALSISYFFFSGPIGAGTILNILVIGPYIDLFNWIGIIPVQSTLFFGLIQLCVGVILMAVAVGLYINADFGAGPRESLVLGMAQKFNISIRVAKTSVEIVVLIIGIILGGQFGLGTIIFALSIGILMQFFLKISKTTR